MNATLADFEGRPVVGSGIEIPGAAGGLREPLKIDPQEWHKGERVVVVLDCTVRRIRLDSVEDEGDDTGEDVRVHILKVTNATIVDAGLVDDALTAQALKVAAAQKAAKDAESGQRTLDDQANEDGINPIQVTVDRAGLAGQSVPFLGYDDLTGGEVIDRIKQSDDRDLIGAIATYERVEGGRATVASACERRLGQLDRKTER